MFIRSFRGPQFGFTSCSYGIFLDGSSPAASGSWPRPLAGPVQRLYRACAGVCLGVIPCQGSLVEGGLGPVVPESLCRPQRQWEATGQTPPSMYRRMHHHTGSQRLSHTFLARRCAPTPSSSFPDVMLGGRELAVSPVLHLPSLQERFQGRNLRQSLMTTPAQLVIAVALIGRPEATGSPCGRRKGGTRAWAQSVWASSYLYFLPCVDAKPSTTNQCAASGCLSPSILLV